MSTDDGYRLYAAASGDRAAFCRLEHVVPWELQGAEWSGSGEAPAQADAPGECSQCGAVLGDSALVLVRHRGEHRIADGFCSVGHLSAWAKAGGRWR